MSLKIIPKIFSYPSPDKGEDAFATNSDSGFFAISDGATDSNYSKEWADLLVNNFIQSGFELKTKNIATWVGPIQKKWYDAVPWEILQEKGDGYFNKAQKGGFATLLGIIIDEQNALTAFAVGDSNIFIMRDDALIVKFPVEESKSFGTGPKLIGSMAKNELSINSLCYKLEKNDLIFLATDAFSKWFMKQDEEKLFPWMDLINLEDQDDFKIFMNKIKDVWNQNDDDITLMILRM